MRVTRMAAIALVGVVAAAGLAACGSSSKTAAKTGATVLNVGMPNGPQTNNSNPFVGSSAGASLGYRFMIYEPLVMTNQVRPADPGKPWLATKWTWSNNYQAAGADHPGRREVVRRPGHDRRRRCLHVPAAQGQRRAEPERDPVR